MVGPPKQPLVLKWCGITLIKLCSILSFFTSAVTAFVFGRSLTHFVFPPNELILSNPLKPLYIPNHPKKTNLFNSLLFFRSQCLKAALPFIILTTHFYSSIPYYSYIYSQTPRQRRCPNRTSAIPRPSRPLSRKPGCAALPSPSFAPFFYRVPLPTGAHPLRFPSAPRVPPPPPTAEAPPPCAPGRCPRFWQYPPALNCSGACPFQSIRWR